ncbi:MAG: DNA methyltransferase [Candidatus Poribacteria bacterium]|nr:DNA methyltransferase [Candidatus Poribacteria bacterium]
MNASTTPDRSPPDANTLYYGDCLDWMRQWEDNCVDLIYLDPPFNSKANYSMLFAGLDKDQAQFRAFCDTWTWNRAAAERYAGFENAPRRPGHGAVVGLYHALGGSGMLAYITYMAERLVEMRRILKDTGSIYLHCDPTASHYLKVLMHDIFGHDNFRNEIVWWYKGTGHPKRFFPRKHDTILFYSSGDRNHFNPIRIKSAKISGWTGKSSKLCDSVWEINTVFQSMERSTSLGYATQKPLALLERVIEASSNEDDLVLDPFCGCGTTIEAAYLLNRRWIGIDISSFAIDLIRRERPHLKDLSIPAHLIPKNIDEAYAMARENRFDFEAWAVDRLPGFAPNTRQTGDGGVDGRGKLAQSPDAPDELINARAALAQVKSGLKVIPDDLRAFIGAMELNKAAIGRFITLEPIQSGDMHRIAFSLGDITVDGVEYPRLKLWSIREFFKGVSPKLPPMVHPYKRNEIIDAVQMRMAFNPME